MKKLLFLFLALASCFASAAVDVSSAVDGVMDGLGALLVVFTAYLIYCVADWALRQIWYFFRGES